MIDASSDTTASIGALKDVGITLVGRYYNQKNSQTLPSKCLTLTEAQALTDAGLGIIVVYQQDQSKASDFSMEKGEQAAKNALKCAERVGQPKGTGIYFAIDFDATTSEVDNNIIPFFEGVNEILEDYTIGAYGSGLVCAQLYKKQLCHLRWLSQSSGFSGTQQAIDSQEYDIRQMYPSGNITGLNVDYNQCIPNGVFQTAFTSTAQQYKVTAPNGLRLRAEPNTSAEILASFAEGTVVTELVSETPIADGWLHASINSENGYMASQYLRAMHDGTT